ncbi:MAG: lysophospholipase L1-like esterase/pimeloyl-ACP methyl ester carboxylesterase [Rubritalea sp.]|jgi:lysophospholipase L1-like esterase/pimeloyl-ACP methyl ester carboxylesterase
MKILSTISLILLSTTALITAKIKVACVGDSITFGAGVSNRAKNCYPAQLAVLLGDDYEVKNFGVSGATMLRNGDKPYIKTKAYQPSLDFEPNIVIIKLGTNDSKPGNWAKKADFKESTMRLISSYTSLTSKPRIILCKPVPVVGEGRWGITEKVTRGEVAKEIEQLALKHQLELVDLHTPLRDKPEFIPDTVHPNAQGAERIAKHLHRYLSQQRTPSLKIVVNWAKNGDNFHGFHQRETGTCKVVFPHVQAKGAPWIWRARFWGHQPQFDVQMLELGYHIVYCDVANLFGAPSAVAKWDECYKLTQEWGLGPKPILEGMSRGGLIIHNWAVANPEKVAGIISDNAVMDIKSWPAGFGTGKGAPSAWKKCKAAYGFKTDDQAKAYLKNPVDTIQALKQANIPLLYLVGADDNVVPPAENSGLAEKKLNPYPLLTVINKPGKGHHPHSLPNPDPITEFALKCSGFSANSTSKK